ncbi:MAG: FAD binding domain-containing protein, partial [Proteobacteria bacterium]|nr:FAD binding domain-containing protein [Pseudomonadota bacterium]
PHMDLPPVLIALGASISIAGAAGERRSLVEDLFTGYYETTLARDELITQLRVPPQRQKRAAYLKCTTGSAQDWPALGIAVVLELDGDAVKSARVVVGAAIEKATRLKQAEKILVGTRADGKTLARAGEAAVAEAEIISDAHGSAPYKRELLRVYIGRAIRQAMDCSGAPI